MSILEVQPKSPFSHIIIRDKDKIIIHIIIDAMILILIFVAMIFLQL